MVAQPALAGPMVVAASRDLERLQKRLIGERMINSEAIDRGAPQLDWIPARFKNNALASGSGRSIIFLSRKALAAANHSESWIEFYKESPLPISQ